MRVPVGTGYISLSLFSTWARLLDRGRIGAGQLRLGPEMAWVSAV